MSCQESWLRLEFVLYSRRHICNFVFFSFQSRAVIFLLFKTLIFPLRSRDKVKKAQCGRCCGMRSTMRQIMSQALVRMQHKTIKQVAILGDTRIISRRIHSTINFASGSYASWTTLLVRTTDDRAQKTVAETIASTTAGQ